MHTKEIKITVPEGYEIDKENSTFECIKFKKKGLTYIDVADSLFKNKKTYYIQTNSTITYCETLLTGNYYDANNATSEKQLQRLLAINKLMNVAEYLNEGWKPDYLSDGIPKWTIIYNKEKYTFDFHQEWFACYSPVVFKSAKLARQAIEILGEEEVKLALGI